MKYRLTGQVTVSVYTEVEADSLEEALEIAEERSEEIDKSSWRDHRVTDMWLCDDFDGMVQDISLSN